MNQSTAQELSERGLLPDALIRAGIRLPLTPLDPSHYDEVRAAMLRAGVELKH